MRKCSKNNEKSIKRATFGFTLVEVLAIITILGVIVILVVPQIGGSINSKKEKELEKIIDIVENAAKAYHSFNPDDYNIPLTTLVNEKYLANNLENPITGEKINGCVRVINGSNDILSYKYETCDTIQVPLNVDRNGGTLSQDFEDTYPNGSKITLVDPTKENNDFIGWRIVRGNSMLNNKILIIGDTSTEIRATWQNWPTLTVDLDEGTTTQSFDTLYQSGTIIALTEPTKEGYTFSGWSVTEGDGLVSGNNFTMGSVNTTLTANWEISSLI